MHKSYILYNIPYSSTSCKNERASLYGISFDFQLIFMTNCRSCAYMYYKRVGYAPSSSQHNNYLSMRQIQT